MKIQLLEHLLPKAQTLELRDFLAVLLEREIVYERMRVELVGTLAAHRAAREGVPVERILKRAHALGAAHELSTSEREQAKKSLRHIDDASLSDEALLQLAIASDELELQSQQSFLEGIRQDRFTESIAAVEALVRYLQDTRQRVAAFAGACGWTLPTLQSRPGKAMRSPRSA